MHIIGSGKLTFYCPESIIVHCLISCLWGLVQFLVASSSLVKSIDSSPAATFSGDGESFLLVTQEIRVLELGWECLKFSFVIIFISIRKHPCKHPTHSTDFGEVVPWLMYIMTDVNCTSY